MVILLLFIMRVALSVLAQASGGDEEVTKSTLFFCVV